MANIQHNTLSDPDLHECKGAVAATAGQVIVAQGNGTAIFRKLNYTDLGTKVTVFGYVPVLSSSNTSATQIPSASDTAKQVLFGSAQSTTNVSNDALGNITFNVAGQYAIRYGFSFFGGTGGAVIFFRVLINGNPIEPTHRVAPSTGEITEFCETFFIDASANDVLTFQIVSDSTGASIGGLSQAAPVASGWSSTPTAEITIYKFSGAQ